ncbi:aminotransferase class V-fold PLP-dependent enzyme [Proteiniborus sp. MB09-C3]|uniref:aminotransferase class V-fold PLP-dependent enzyme n=1 Tax=Proteiniborus sp. MB09-C3 TaxID=3050072 RepID=UPI0025552625|nr:aminotransferase class V-fold PLP-dependent enzyme [Proteiniborus sp. MB09-C3]WIV13862.1 aminotransferase class V-fold PLP-dependent enzyme [Proteiniborus sp. MB09-C3]
MLFKNKLSIDNIRKNIIGINKKVILRNGKSTNYIYFDNAASTPALIPVLEKVSEFLEWYSSIHRGAGYKSVISTRTYDDSRKIVADFLNADFEKNAVIYVKNSTEAINKLSYRLQLDKNDIVISSLMEHHSNDLPWRNKCNTLFINLLKDGSLDLNDLEKKLNAHKGRIKLVTVTGCSNVTGYINDIHYIARLSHKYGAKILVDAAQLAPHRAINMKGNRTDEHLDFVVLSGHKLYAPFGTGVLVGPKTTFQNGEPEYTGGGTIISVSQNNVYYAAPPEREEAGSPNIVGAVALAESIKIINEIGMDNIKDHEIMLTKYFLENIKKISEIQIYSNTNEALIPDTAGVISFNIPDLHHSLLAALLSYEGGIGVRNGCFCAHPYIHRLLNLSPTEIRKIQQDMMFGRLEDVPGLVRVSFGMYNTIQEIDIFMEVLSYIMKNKKDICSEYKYISSAGRYEPKNLPKNIYSEFTL